MKRLIHEDPKQPDAAPKAGAKETAAGGQSVKIAIAAGLFVVAGVVLYMQGAFSGGKNAVTSATPPMTAEQKANYDKEQAASEEISRQRQKAINEGRAPKPITTNNN